MGTYRHNWRVTAWNIMTLGEFPARGLAADGCVFQVCDEEPYAGLPRWESNSHEARVMKFFRI